MIPNSRNCPVSRFRQITIALLLFIALVVSSAACAKRSRPVSTLNESSASAEQPRVPNSRRLNINTASVKELETLPGIGAGLAERIVEHREKYGPFRRAEHLMMVRGISDARYRAVRHLITVE